MMNEETKKTLTTFFSKYPLKKFKKGELILKPGEKPNFVGFVKTGFARVYTLSDSGQEISMSFFKPILYFTTLYAMNGKANKFYFEAISPMEMWAAPKDEFIEYCRKNTMIANEIMATISDLFLGLVDHMGKLLSGNSLAKVAMIIASITDNRAHFALTHKMVASLTGLTRETVTLQMLKLEKLKLTDNKGRKVTILDRDGLDKVIAG